MANSKGRYQPHNKSNCNSSIISTAGGLAKVQTWFCNQKGKKAITISKKRSSGTQLQCFILVGRIQESPSSPLSSMYFQVAVVGADFRLLPQKCTDFIFAICTAPPRRRNWSTNPWTTPTNRDEMICTNTHYNSQKVRRHGAMSWRSEKYTSHAGKQTDVYRWSKHLTANWCYLMMFLPTWWWPSWPSWYIQGHPERMRKGNGFNGQGLKAQWRRQVLRMSPKGMGKRFLVCLMMKSEWKGLYYELMWRKVLEEWVRTICKRNRMWVVHEVIWSTLGPAVQVRW